MVSTKNNKKTKRPTQKSKTKVHDNIMHQKQPPAKIERWIVIPDIHCSVAGDHDVYALATAEEFMASQVWDGYLNLGDLIDFGIIAINHNVNNLRAVEGGRILEEYKVADKILTRHEKIIRSNNPSARMVYCEGNHCDRITRWINANPACENMIEVPTVLKLAERKIEWVPSWSEGKLFELGQCSFHHGIYTIDGHAKKHVTHFQRNILYGHCHDIQVYSSPGYRASDGMIGASLGCLCKIPQKYLKGAPTRWSHAVTVFEWNPSSGDFSFNILRMNNYKLIYDGKVYGG